MTTRRRLLAGALAFLSLAGCDFFNSPGNVAYSRGDYAIDMQRNRVRPVKPDDVAVFKQVGPLDWNRVRDPATAQRIVDDFNANPAQWREMLPYEEQRLWFPIAEPPLM